MHTTTRVERLEVATRDVLRAHEAIRDTYAGHRLIIRGSQENFRYRQATTTAGDLAVDSLQHTMSVREDVDPIDATWVGLLTGGLFRAARAGEEIRCTAGDVLLFPQGVPFICEWQVLELQMVRVPTGEIAARAAALAGIDPVDFRFRSMAPLSPTLHRYCANTIGYLHSLFAGENPAVAQPLVKAAALDAVAAAVLATFPSTATTDGPGARAGRAAPAAVRRAVDYIDAHADQPLTVADIARATGIGPRALQEAFRRHRGTTPTAYLRDARLERAHRELQAADPALGATVAAIAARWGFAHRGRFATAYRDAFGRSPQQTLRS
ncbi:MAG TPA: helix-turn-helix transcriptional regulator [Blastococcus sp.]|nr:helix-turn-helix transcriptional regulator [Blastococcus sp.]